MLSRKEKEIVIKFCDLFTKCRFVKAWLDEYKKEDKHTLEAQAKTMVLTNKGNKWIDELAALDKEYETLLLSDKAKRLTHKYLTKKKVEELSEEVFSFSFEDLLKAAVTLRMKENND